VFLSLYEQLLWYHIGEAACSTLPMTSRTQVVVSSGGSETYDNGHLPHACKIITASSAIAVCRANAVQFAAGDSKLALDDLMILTMLYH
jgi:hypothetical protein